MSVGTKKSRRRILPRKLGDLLPTRTPEEEPLEEVGAPAGIESLVADAKDYGSPDDVAIRCVDYSVDRVERTEVDAQAIEKVLGEPKPEWARARWISVVGLHPVVVDRLHRALGFHTLAAEDIVDATERPRLDVYPDHMLVIARCFCVEEQELSSRQVSFVLASRDVLITFEEAGGDLAENLLQRIERIGGRTRSHGADFLLYAMLDVLIDRLYPILEDYSEDLENLEDELLRGRDEDAMARIHHIKGDLLALRRVMWPTRQMIDALQRDEAERLSKATETWMRDVQEHAAQVLDIVGSLREMTGGLADLNMNILSTRMNEVMKVLTIVTTLFIPATFLAGVYGMNFHYFPELQWRWAYPAFWVISLASMGGLLVYFRKKGWLG
ncbi:MAG TPA: magnesium/cobalt transporter CorA [Planctomycetes bacterium]|nr:magnesium/cobalt transporter CorA [Planctomycetota bacterium]